MKSNDKQLLYIYLFFDLIFLNISIIITAWIFIHILHYGLRPLGIYFLQGNFSLLITNVILTKRNIYFRDGLFNRFFRITKRIAVLLLVSVIVAFLFYRKLFILKFLCSYILLLYIINILFYGGFYLYLLKRRKKGEHVCRCIIFGQSESSRKLRAIIDSNPILGYKFLGYVDERKSALPEYIGEIKDIEHIIENHRLDLIFVPPANYPEFEKKYNWFINLCCGKGIRLRFIPEERNWNRMGANIETLNGIPLTNPLEIPLDSITARLIKRSFDLGFSFLIILTVFSWLFPIIALMIKLSSKGPVFFVQERTGYNNKTFRFLKFRTMKVNGEANKKQATKNDNRITGVGKFLRKSNLDELPQFLNVFMGQMSVVGPRPHMLEHTRIYSDLIDYYLLRHFVKPGITGWAQVNGYRGETDKLWKMERRVKYDIEYIKNWSFWMDMEIIFLTVFGYKTYRNAR
ncbi:MAG: exopolysaccharide biosynthesis polyprenyl glycosylphosphotransferase [Bacteroidota bacterium]|nr:exopolysaccharide biosynthesis polyprenyl glycosylphosphotransferase [Bacteroidota bacterium]MDP4227504.1 exopolysaccharide biosynthesis polyprenyl glycosylphosphotransferase [Bacteroidota bacterium]